MSGLILTNFRLLSPSDAVAVPWSSALGISVLWV